MLAASQLWHYTAILAMNIPLRGDNIGPNGDAIHHHRRRSLITGGFNSQNQHYTDPYISMQTPEPLPPLRSSSEVTSHVKPRWCSYGDGQWQSLDPPFCNLDQLPKLPLNHSYIRFFPFPLMIQKNPPFSSHQAYFSG